MYDALSIAALVDELNGSLVNGRIQQILQVDSLTIAFEMYALRQRRWLTMSAHPTDARLLLSERRVDGDPERVTPLLLLLRKYARGGRIVAVSQPRYERILRVSIAKPLETDNSGAGSDDVGNAQLVCSELYVELMGRRSNIILTDASGRILDAIKRVSPDMSRVRPIRPGMAYVPPPPQDKLDPSGATSDMLLQSSSESHERLDRWLVATYVAVSPQIAREIASRAGLRADQPAGSLERASADSLEDAIRAVFGPLATGLWSPVVYMGNDAAPAFSPFPLASLAHSGDTRAVPCATMSAATELAWESRSDDSSSASSASRHAARRQRLLEEVIEARERVDQRLRSLQEQEKRSLEAEAMRLKGEAIYASISQIGPRQETVTTFDGLTIALDPSLSPSENAQAYFERYRKARSAEDQLPALIDTARREREYVDHLRLSVEQAETYDEIETVRLEWLAFASDTRGLARVTRPKGARPAHSARRPRSLRLASGHIIFIGRTGRQNDTVTFDIANPGDLWLHARDMPGAHVILRSTATIDDAAIEAAAALAAWYSDGRQSTTVPVDVTERRYVRKIKSAGPGMVTYRNERTLNVQPRSESDLSIETTPVAT
ncbi:MAG TPA: NFACT family protein [Thermomicrobiales bacterium]|nr:NFACT family protein [Thermomicrobiales bacterium]